jgi:hypothetical protein
MGQQLTGDYQAVAASQQRALQLFRDLGNQLGQAEALNKLGELATQTQATSKTGDQHTQAMAIARDLGARQGRKPAPWKASATATSTTATPATPRSTCGRHWPCTGASAPPPPSASRKPLQGHALPSTTRAPTRAAQQQRPSTARSHRAINQAPICGSAQPRVQPNNLICACTGQKTPSTANMQSGGTVRAARDQR